MRLPSSLLKLWINLDYPKETIALALTELGIEVEGIEEIKGDLIYDLSLTPDKGYAKSIFGLASDLAAYFNLPLPSKRQSLPKENEKSEKLFAQCLADKECDFLLFIPLSGIKSGPSPDWLVSALEKCGINSVNSAVDITNYVMLMVGQPMHLYDRRALENDHLELRALDEAKDFTALNLKNYTVPKGSLGIFSGQKLLSLAGIMGSDSSGVDGLTTEAVLEIGSFKGAAIRKTSRALSLRTESSHRFETGIDLGGALDALGMALELFEKLTCAKASSIIFAKKPSFTPKTISFSYTRAAELLGVDLGASEFCALFRRNGSIVHDEGTTLTVIPPSHRSDLESFIDLVEEAARLFGYTKLTPKVPPSPLLVTKPSPLYLLEQKARRAALAEGLKEWLTPPLMSQQLASLESDPALARSEVQVLYAKSQEHSILRASFFAGMLTAARHNLHRGVDSIAAFEIGKLHFRDKEGFSERLAAGFLLCGKKRPYHPFPKEEDVDFFDLKGHLENWLTRFHCPSLFFEASSFTIFHPGRQAALLSPSGDRLGFLGQVHPEIVEKLGVKKPLYFAEVDLEALLSQSEASPYVKTRATPSTPRDWTLTLKKQNPIGPFLAAAKKLLPKEAVDFFVLDLFENEKLKNEGCHNVTFRTIYQSFDGALEAGFVDELQKKLQKELMSQSIENFS